MKTIYKDYCGSYSIEVHRDGSATLRCRNNGNYNLDYNRDYKNEAGAKRALSRYCDGMPEKIQQNGLEHNKEEV